MGLDYHYLVAFAFDGYLGFFYGFLFVLLS